jgi:hypothetical protein
MQDVAHFASLDVWLIERALRATRQFAGNQIMLGKHTLDFSALVEQRSRNAWSQTVALTDPAKDCGKVGFGRSFRCLVDLAGCHRNSIHRV